MAAETATTLAFELQLWDAAADAGTGLQLAAGSLEVDVSTLQPRQEQTTTVRLQSAAKARPSCRICH